MAKTTPSPVPSAPAGPSAFDHWLAGIQGMLGDFFSADWWAGIAGIAAVLSLIAIVLALREYFDAKRRLSGVLWVPEGDAEAHERNSGDFIERIAFTQQGLHDVWIRNWYAVGCTHFKLSGQRLPWRVRAGETVHVSFRSRRPDKAWIMVTWIDLHDIRWLHAQWFPIVSNKSTASVFDGFGRDNQPVGPGGASRSKIRLAKMDSKWDRFRRIHKGTRLEQLLSEVTQADAAVLGQSLRDYESSVEVPRPGE